ncbi:MAG: hypothetical protein WCJ19_01615 [bacterium]
MKFIKKRKKADEEEIIKKKIVKKISTKKSSSHLDKQKSEIKPYMDYLGIKNFKAIPLGYYLGSNKLFIIETDFLETFVLKIFDKNAYKYSSSIEKHFSTNARNISSLTPKINVAYEGDKELNQFYFSDRMPGSNKNWSKINDEEKENLVIEIAKIFFKVHTYTSKKVLREIVYGKVSSRKKSWVEFIENAVIAKLTRMKSAGLDEDKCRKFEKYSENILFDLKTTIIPPTLLHGSICLNKDKILRSVLFVGNKVSAILNSEESIYGDKLWDLAVFYKQVLVKDENLEKLFFREYGKLRQSDKERLDFYYKLQIE